jgi:hypothetical protein
MTSVTLHPWHLTTTSTVTRPMCAKQAATVKGFYFCGRNIDGKDGP